MLHCARNPHPSVRLQEEQNIPSVSSPAKVTGAIQKVSRPPLSRWHRWQWQPAPVSAPFPSPTFAVSSSPGIFQQQSLPSHDSRDSHTPLPPALAHGCVHWPDFSDLALSGELLLTSLCRELLPEAPRLTGIHSCSSATSNQSLSRKDFYSSHSWEQLPVRSETNKKTTLKAMFN